MNQSPERPEREKEAARRARLAKEIAAKETRKVKARREGDRSIWFGLGMFGLVGWTVAIPTLIGVAVGAWIDRTWPSRISWTITLLVSGVALGCWNAWWWLQKEGGDYPPDGSNPGSSPSGRSPQDSTGNKR